METESLIPVGNIKQEPDYEDQKVKEEVNGEEESDMSSVLKSAGTSSTSQSCCNEDIILYCEKCQLKYEGDCPEHGHLIYVDKAEVGQGEGFSHNSSPQDLVANNKDGQGPGGEDVLQSHVCEARSDDVGSLPNGVCGTDIYTRNSFTCDVCGAEFSYCSQLKRHMRTHTGEKLYKCDLCGIGFAHHGHLNRHKRTHTEEKPYKCDVCGVGFAVSGNLITHQRTHTGDKPYKCDICGVGFAQSGNLITHKRTHSGNKLYKCDVCGVGFAWSGTLKRHMRTHTGERPYKCDTCGVGFTIHANLKVHQRVHTGEKPYKCDVCDARFSQSGHLKKHSRIHTGKT